LLKLVYDAKVKQAGGDVTLVLWRAVRGSVLWATMTSRRWTHAVRESVTSGICLAPWVNSAATPSLYVHSLHN